MLNLPTSSKPIETCERCGRHAADHHVGDVCVQRDHVAAISLPWQLRSVQLSGAGLERRRNARRLAMADHTLE